MIDADVETLILGSFPSVASLGKAQYYGHAQNHFWRLVGAVIAEPLYEMEYAQRLKMLLQHRIGLWDAYLIKENHIEMAGGITAAVAGARAADADLPLEVECCNLDQVDEAIAAGAERLLLDNMTPTQLSDVVAHVSGRAELEASGGITLTSVAEIAASGVQFISVGAITHSAAALDLSLIVEVER